MYEEGVRTIWRRNSPVPTEGLAGEEEEGELVGDPADGDVAADDFDGDLGSGTGCEAPIEHEHADFEEVEGVDHSLHG